MKTLLNDGPDFDVASNAVDSVDRLLATSPDVEGLVFSERGFTYVGPNGQHVLGLRDVREEDSSFSYSLSSADPSMTGMARVDFVREGYELFVTHQTEPLAENKALIHVAELGNLALK